MSGETLAAAQAVYDRLWAQAQTRFATGAVNVDPHLLDRSNDRRRGISLLIRLAPEIGASLAALIAEIDAITPGQHWYPAEKLHITILSLISAAPDVTLDAIPVARYDAVFKRVIPALTPFDIHLTHLGASPDSVFVYGQSAGDALNALREALRGPLQAAGLADRMEQRYQSVTTHSTILRFQTQPAPEQVRALHAWIAAHRERAPHNLGTMSVREVEFVYNDWYLSRDVVRVLGRYALDE